MSQRTIGEVLNDLRALLEGEDLDSKLSALQGRLASAPANERRSTLDAILRCKRERQLRRKAESLEPGERLNALQNKIVAKRNLIDKSARKYLDKFSERRYDRSSAAKQKRRARRERAKQ